MKPGAGKEQRASFPQQIAGMLAEEITDLDQTLAGRFGTSRASIREALYLLAQKGIVERIPRKGAVVRRYTPCEIEEIYKVRVTLEELALERDCDGMRMVRSAVTALEPIGNGMERALDALREGRLS